MAETEVQHTTHRQIPAVTVDLNDLLAGIRARRNHPDDHHFIHHATAGWVNDRAVGESVADELVSGYPRAEPAATKDGGGNPASVQGRTA